MWLLRRALLFFRVSEFVLGEDGVAGLVWLMIILFALSWWYGR
jgi:hypothetical protein